MSNLIGRRTAKLLRRSTIRRALVTAREGPRAKRYNPPTMVDVRTRELARRLVDPDVASGQSQERVAEWLDEALREANGRWPGVKLDSEVFVDHLARCLPAAGDREAELMALRSDDLFLACACGHGDARAIATLIERYRPILGRIFATPSARGVDHEDLEQLLMERLMAGTANAPPKILDYTGRGKLIGWIRVVATSMRIDSERRRSDKSGSLDEEAIGRIEDAMSSDMELSFLKQHYRAAFKEVFGRVLRALEPSQRNLLRLSVIEGLSATQIARVHGVHRATGKRWLAQIRVRLLEDTERGLAEHLGIDRDAVDSVLQMIRTGLEASIRRRLLEDA